MMNDIETEDLIRYVSGRAAPDVRERIEAAAANDEELSAKLAWVAALAGVPLPPPASASRAKTKRRLSRRRALLAATSVLAGCGLSWAAYAFVYDRPLLADNFSDGWLDPRLWRGERPIIREEKGHLMLMNRGVLVTREQFPLPIELSLDWQWLNLAGDPVYSDDLAIALRTPGRAMSVRPFDVNEGVLIRFRAGPGQVSISRAKGQIPFDALGVSPEGSLPMPAESWHHIRIADDGREIAVYMTGGAIPPTKDGEPVIRVRCPDDSRHHHIAIFNREFIASAPQESRIDNVVIRALR